MVALSVEPIGTVTGPVGDVQVRNLGVWSRPAQLIV